MARTSRTRGTGSAFWDPYADFVRDAYMGYGGLQEMAGRETANQMAALQLAEAQANIPSMHMQRQQQERALNAQNILQGKIQRGEITPEEGAISLQAFGAAPSDIAGKWWDTQKHRDDVRLREIKIADDRRHQEAMAKIELAKWKALYGGGGGRGGKGGAGAGGAGGEYEGGYYKQGSLPFGEFMKHAMEQGGMTYKDALDAYVYHSATGMNPVTVQENRKKQSAALEELQARKGKTDTATKAEEARKTAEANAQKNAAADELRRRQAQMNQNFGGQIQRTPGVNPLPGLAPDVFYPGSQGIRPGTPGAQGPSFVLPKSPFLNQNPFGPRSTNPQLQRSH